jgi:hypothetical protein
MLLCPVGNLLSILTEVEVNVKDLGPVDIVYLLQLLVKLPRAHLLVADIASLKCFMGIEAGQGNFRSHICCKYVLTLICMSNGQK